MGLNEKILKAKFILMGTDNDGVRHRYSVLKNEKFKNAFIKFMASLGFEQKIISEGFRYFTEEEGNRSIKISEINDVCRYYNNKEYEIDIFYGGKRIILVIRTNQKDKRVRRDRLIKNLKKESKWMKFPKLKRINEKKKKILLGPVKAGSVK